MPERTVTIRRDPKDRKRCIIVPSNFDAQLNDTVKFVHDPDLPTVQITFRNGSPFEDRVLQSGPTLHAVKTKGTFAYDVSWPEPDGDGVGNGTGDVPPS
jgi:hypothetical protein